MFDKSLWLLSGEFLLAKRSNGGGVILRRSIIVTMFVYFLCLLLRTLLAWQFPASKEVEVCISGKKFWEAFLAVAGDTLPWAGAILGACYAAFYARFASQWSYLSDLYNQIKRAELDVELASSVSPAATLALSSWKAGFIEDASELHLAGKQIFRHVIEGWWKQPEVRMAFQRCASNVEERLAHLRAVGAISQRDPAEVFSRERG